MENFKNLNESVNEGRGSNNIENADENFNDEENSYLRIYYLGSFSQC